MSGNAVKLLWWLLIVGLVGLTFGPGWALLAALAVLALSAWVSD